MSKAHEVVIQVAQGKNISEAVSEMLGLDEVSAAAMNRAGEREWTRSLAPKAVSSPDAQKKREDMLKNARAAFKQRRAGK